MAERTESWPKCPLRFRWYFSLLIEGQIPPKENNFGSVNWRFGQTLQIVELSYYRKYCIDHTHFCKTIQGRRSLWDRGDMSPNIYEGGDVHGNVPQYFKSDVVRLSTRVTARNYVQILKESGWRICCILVLEKLKVKNMFFKCIFCG